MNICASVIVILAAIAVVESCWHFNPFRSDFSKKCDHWWKKAGRYAGHRNRAIKRCVVLVQDKCPARVLTTAGKIDKRVYKHYTLWKTQVIATYTPTQVSVKFFKKQKRGVCADDDGGPGNCNFWWDAAMWTELDTHMVNKCVTQVLKNCPDMLDLVRDTTSNKKHQGENIDVQELTYKHRTTGKEVTFRKYHFQSVGPKHSSG